MLTIRLQRMGKTKRPSYRFIVSENHRDTQAGSLEILGYYNPVEKDKTLQLNKDRVEYWLSVGAQASATVHNILVKEGIVKGKKEKSVYLSKKRQGKLAAKKAAAAPAEPAAPAAAPEAGA